MRLTADMIEALDLESSFVPPHPVRHEQAPSRLRGMFAARENLLSMFQQRDFQTRRVHARVFGQDYFLCNNPDGVRETLSAQHNAFQKKTPQQCHSLEPLLGDGLFVSDGDLWKERRGIVAPIVHGRHIAKFAPIMRETVVEWCAQWHAAGRDATLDVLAEMGELTAEIISRTIFGRRLGRRYTHQIVSGFAEYQRNVDAVDVPTVLGLPEWLPRHLSRKARRARDQIHDALDVIIDEVEKGRLEGSDAMIHSLFGARDRDGKPLTRDAIRNEAIVIFMAGHETTANTLAWALYLISQSRRVREKLLEECDRVLSGRVPELSDLPKMTYTRAVVEETLRLYPPVPLLGRTAIDQGTLNGLDVHPGATLVVAPWLIHRNSEVWSLPDHFVPERFDRANNPLTDKYSFIPFASGPRVCPGLTFAMTEAMICLAVLVQTFEMRLAEGHRVNVECRLTLRPGSRLPMRIRWRPAPPTRAARKPMRATDIDWARTYAAEPQPPPLRSLLRAGDVGRAARRYHVIDRLGGAFELAMHNLFRAMPPEWSSAFAAHVVLPVVRGRFIRQPILDRMLANAAKLRPDLDRAAHEEIVATWLRNAARAFAEYGAIDRTAAPPRLSYEGEGHLEAVRHSDRPIIVTTVHTGAWETITVVAYRDFGDNLIGPYSPQKSRFKNRIVANTRKRIGAKALPPSPGLGVTLLRFLAEPDNAVVLVIDAIADGNTHFPLFGRDWSANCNANFAVRAALKSKALILPTTLTRTAGVASTFSYHAPIDPAALGEEGTRAALNDLYEPFILDHLDEWYMLHALKF
ncbi:MAG: cytochrome P450 [Pseudomonadota bacterium]